MTLDEAVARIVARTRALARRQLAWFRRDPRIRWFRAGPDGAAGIVDELTEYLRDG
jgi:tRNA dimethylallyltransferase